MGDEHGQGSGFRVKDRRRFSETGEPRDTAPDDASGAAAPDATPSASDAAASSRAAASSLPPVTFSSFVLGLSTQALMHLGEVGDPEVGGAHRDLVAAKQVIDILGLLQAKTQGNLGDDEQGLLEGVLYDLRIRYVELTRKETS